MITPCLGAVYISHSVSAESPLGASRPLCVLYCDSTNHYEMRTSIKIMHFPTTKHLVINDELTSTQQAVEPNIGELPTDWTINRHATF